MSTNDADNDLQREAQNELEQQAELEHDQMMEHHIEQDLAEGLNEQDRRVEVEFDQRQDLQALDQPDNDRAEATGLDMQAQEFRDELDEMAHRYFDNIEQIDFRLRRGLDNDGVYTEFDLDHERDIDPDYNIFPANIDLSCGLADVPGRPASLLPHLPDTMSPDATCTICLDALVDTVFLPCGHLIACKVSPSCS